MSERWCNRSQSGFTLWELLIVIVLVVTFMLVAVETLLPLRGEAERAAHLYTVNVLRSAVGMQAAERVIRRGADGLAAMDGANPVDWLAVPPKNYAGEIGGDDYEKLPRGGWGFDTDNGWLVYRIRYPEYGTSGSSLPVVRFRVHVERSAAGAIRGIGLRSLDTVEWRTDGSELRRWMEELSQ